MTQNPTEDGEALAKMAHQVQALCTEDPVKPRISRALRKRGLFYLQKGQEHIQGASQTSSQEEGSSDPVPLL